MPRGRPKGSKNKAAQAPGPDLESVGVVTADTAAEEVVTASPQSKPKKKTVTPEERYCRFLFMNLEEPGQNLPFGYENLNYNFVHNKECVAKRKVVDWINSLTYPKPVTDRDANGKKITRIEKMNRFMCRILEETDEKPEGW